MAVNDFILYFYPFHSVFENVLNSSLSELFLTPIIIHMVVLLRNPPLSRSCSYFFIFRAKVGQRYVLLFVLFTG